MSREQNPHHVFSPPVFLLVLLFGSSLVSGQSPNQPPVPPDIDVVRVSTSLVTVPVSVMDRQGRFVPDLGQTQFHLFENGVEQEIAFFENAQKPFTVALLLDTSDSARFKLAEIQEAAIGFIEQLRPDDRVLVVTFDKEVRVLTEATGDRRILRDAIRRTQTGGGTSLYSAIDAVVTKRLSRIKGRKAIVLFTDGVDTTSVEATYESTLRAAEELDSLIYSIRYNTYEDLGQDQNRVLSGGSTSAELRTAKGERLSVAYDRADRYLRALADKSGGRPFYAANKTHLATVFSRIAQELREQYSLGYYPKNRDGSAAQRSIKLKVDAPDIAVHARRTYLYKAGPDNSNKQ